MHFCVTIDIFARSRQPRWLLASLKQCSLVTTLEHSSTPSEAPRNAALSPKCLSLFEPLSVFYSVSLCWHNYTQLNLFAFVKKTLCFLSKYHGIKIIQHCIEKEYGTAWNMREGDKCHYKITWLKSWKEVPLLLWISVNWFSAKTSIFSKMVWTEDKNQKCNNAPNWTCPCLFPCIIDIYQRTPKSWLKPKLNLTAIAGAEWKPVL